MGAQEGLVPCLRCGPRGDDRAGAFRQHQRCRELPRVPPEEELAERQDPHGQGPAHLLNSCSGSRRVRIWEKSLVEPGGGADSCTAAGREAVRGLDMPRVSNPAFFLCASPGVMTHDALVRLCSAFVTLLVPQRMRA